MYIQSCLLQEMNDAKKKKKAFEIEVGPKPKHTGKRKQWTEESMIAAMEAVKSVISVSRAALEHNVPRTTLQDRHLWLGIYLLLQQPIILLTLLINESANFKLTVKNFVY